MIRLAAGEKTFEADVRLGAGAVRVEVDGSLFALAVTPTGPGAFVVRDGLAVARLAVVEDGDTLHFAWGGSTYRLVRQRAGVPAPKPPDGGAIQSPMPGRVVGVEVEVGQEVRKGDVLIVVESMKMENALRAPRDGTVRGVAVRVGDRVTPGVPLVDLA